MIIGIPKEIKNNENRVGMTPAGVYELLADGHKVYVQQSAGIGSGFSDEMYIKAGATILPCIEDVYAKSDMIVKVKEPLESEYLLVRSGQVVFTYFHFASDRQLLEAMKASGAVCLAYETVQTDSGQLPLLVPMSQVAGRMAAQNGAYYLQKTQGGKGKLMAGVPGVLPARVLVLGGGTVGVEAARVAAGMGADVIIADISLPRLKYLDAVMPKNVRTLFSSESNIGELLCDIDVVIGAVLIPGAKAPQLVTREMLSLMQPGTVLVDVAIDQGGCFETSHPTQHDDPVYVVDDILHYAVANIPGAVPYTSTMALTNATLLYVREIANKGWKRACEENKSLARGLNIVEHKVVLDCLKEI